MKSVLAVHWGGPRRPSIAGGPRRPSIVPVFGLETNRERSWEVSEPREGFPEEW